MRILKARLLQWDKKQSEKQFTLPTISPLPRGAVEDICAFEGEKKKSILPHTGHLFLQKSQMRGFDIVWGCHKDVGLALGSHGGFKQYKQWGRYVWIVGRTLRDLDFLFGSDRDLLGDMCKLLYLPVF